MTAIEANGQTIIGPMPKYFIPAVGGSGKVFGLVMERPPLPCQRPPQTLRLFGVFVDDPSDPAPQAIRHLHTFYCN